ncbi:type VI secretion system amidase effector protein Tae4 [Paraburkholderia bannensis]|uniref:type VI secretion system amidase effector protein Tae4 n=1 Tax=Paraburkholderia bannensis TaxID=765414 RepID=UPI0004845F88|nr:type VI secretion system amidase effector protein Tae4 [Paraburkholderia bannensis]
MPNPRTVVRTNNIPGSIKHVQLRVVTFQELWDAYPSGNPYDNPDYKDQCAIRMSVMFHRVGIEMKSFTDRLIKPLSGQPTIGRILLDGKATATRADELAEWLKLQPMASLPKPEDITGSDWQAKIKGRTGIIQFSHYWARKGETDKNPSGGHIDLWDGRRLTVSSPFNAVATVSRMFGRSSFLPGSLIGWSDLGKSTRILFWAIK